MPHQLILITNSISKAKDVLLLDLCKRYKLNANSGHKVIVAHSNSGALLNKANQRYLDGVGFAGTGGAVGEEELVLTLQEILETRVHHVTMVGTNNVVMWSGSALIGCGSGPTKFGQAGSRTKNNQISSFKEEKNIFKSVPQP